MRKLLHLFAVGALLSCHNSQDAPTIPAEHITPTRQQQERREASERYCKAHNIPVYANPNALFVNTDGSVTLRTKDEVVDRAVALCYIGLKSEGLSKELLDKMDKDYGISAKLSPEEKAYAEAPSPTEQQAVNAGWRYEGMHVLLWALSFIDSLGYPAKESDVARSVKIIDSLGPQGLRDKAKLRTKKEILDAADLILRIDWACVNARVNNTPVPGGLNKDVVDERHHALNWLIRYLNEDWDDVTTDT